MPSETIDISSIAPEKWSGELTDDKLRSIVCGLLIPNQAMSVRLASELLKVGGAASGEGVKRPKRLEPMITGKRVKTVQYGIKAASDYTVAAESYMDHLECENASLSQSLIVAHVEANDWCRRALKAEGMPEDELPEPFDHIPGWLRAGKAISDNRKRIESALRAKVKNLEEGR